MLGSSSYNPAKDRGAAHTMRCFLCARLSLRGVSVQRQVCTRTAHTSLGRDDSTPYVFRSMQERRSHCQMSERTCRG